MRKFEQMKDAHRSLYTIMDETELLLDNLEANSSLIAKNISRLTGVLKIHLTNEDKFLYPAMKDTVDSKLKKLATQYEIEMGKLGPEFLSFKDKYNTTSRVISHSNIAKSEIQRMFKKVRVRMDKEDHELYPLAESVMK